MEKPSVEELSKQRVQQAEDYVKRAVESSAKLREFIRNREHGLFQVLNPNSTRGFRLGR